MLYKTAARSAEVLALDVEDLDLPNRCARVRTSWTDTPPPGVKLPKKEDQSQA